MYNYFKDKSNILSNNHVPSPYSTDSEHQVFFWASLKIRKTHYDCMMSTKIPCAVQFLTNQCKVWILKPFFNFFFLIFNIYFFIYARISVAPLETYGFRKLQLGVSGRRNNWKVTRTLVPYSCVLCYCTVKTENKYFSFAWNQYLQKNSMTLENAGRNSAWKSML